MSPSRELKVLFAGMQWDYGNPQLGPSYEFSNLYDALAQMPGVQAGHFDFMAAHRGGGPAAVKDGLNAAVASFDPDLVFFFLFEDELAPDLLVDLRDRVRPVTFNWFADDHWRFDSFTRHYAPLFNWVSTTAHTALGQYEAAGIDHVLKTQWGCNHRRYRPTGRPVSHSVTFVGQAHGDRPWVVKRAARRGLEIEAFGGGWPAGRISTEEMIRLFAESRVNLNLTNASNDPRIPRVIRGMARRIYPPVLHWFGRGLEQIKGRNFEIPGCGGFQLSGRADDIETYFEPDREIALFDSTDGMIDSAKRWLADEPGRARVAEAGYRRTLAEHTFEHRFRDLFTAMGFDVRS